VVVIETERLVLRPLGPSDLEDFLALYNEPEVARFTMSFDRAAGERRLEQVAVEWQDRGYGAMAVLERGSERFLGRAGLKYWPQFGETEVGWALPVREWGRGYATEAGRACIDWGFATFPLDYITAMIHPDNERSLRVAQRLGLQPLREDVLLETPVTVHAVSRPADQARAA
jgi:RimJ/RimL family protein N-acetyltransferase